MAEEKVLTRDQKLAPIYAKAWKDPKFLAELKRDPKGVLKKEFGVDLPGGVSIEVREETPQKLYLVLPPVPEVAGQLSDEQLEAVAGGACIPAGVTFAIANPAAVGAIVGAAGAAVVAVGHIGGWMYNFGKDLGSGRKW